MVELIVFGFGLWIGFYWGKFKTLPPVFEDLKDDLGKTK